jgi:glycosyltransferase involved in cell wall biosynthesis
MPSPRLGVVTIGRNEGERFRRCVESIRRQTAAPGAVVYVDSGSTDGSVAFARERGVDVVELDMSRPFNMARARNAGLRRLLELMPDAEYVQFVDGDCELNDRWLEAGLSALTARRDAALVVGRLRERRRGATVYNTVADMDWDAPAGPDGEVAEVGGIVLARVGALTRVGPYNETLIAGEDADIGVRLRAVGWKLFRIPADMALHDIDMTRLSQFWKRCVRTGWAFAECSRLHRDGPVRLWDKEARSGRFWGLMVPLLTLATVLAAGPAGLAPLAGYPLLAWKMYRGRRRRGDTVRDSAAYSALHLLGKFAQAWGQLRYHRSRLAGRRGLIIEYKPVPVPALATGPTRTT